MAIAVAAAHTVRRGHRLFSTVSKQSRHRKWLSSFISQGPLFKHLPPQRQPHVDVAPQVLASWIQNAEAIAASVFGESDASPRRLDQWSAAENVRIFHMYLPIYEWIKARVGAIRAQQSTTATQAEKPATVVVGLSCVQGGGKTTLVNALRDLMRQGNSDDTLTCVAVSIDDFYLTHADQVAVAAAHSDNPLLQVRGTFGTHDTDLGSSTLQQLRNAVDGDTVSVPVYNKWAYHGQGDRAPKEEWPAVPGPVDVVLFEGWNLVPQPC